ncbi:MAG: recombinase family protein [Acidimicrobiales bacterium]
MAHHVSLYTRLSKDRTGRAENVTAQERRGRLYAAEHWPDVPVEVYCDNDASAASDAVPRPDFERLRADIAAGRVTQVWAVEQSRLTRSEAGWFEFAAELVAAGIDVVHTERDGVVRLDEVAGIKAVLNGAEVRRLRQRVNDKLDDLAAEGRPTGGRSYGYRHVVDAEGHKALEIIPEQAQTARWAAEAVLSGWSLSNIARELDRRGAPTAQGGKWATTTVRTMLTSPTIAGYRIHRGEIVGRGNWEPILDEVTWRQVKAVFSAPATVLDPQGRPRKVSRWRRTPRRYLLTGGVARCGRCGKPLVAQQRRGRTPGSQPGYYCHASRGGCNGIGILADPLEAHVVEVLLAELDKPEFYAAFATDEHEAHRARITSTMVEVDERRGELARMWARREINQDEWAQARTGLEAEHQRLQNELAAVPAPLAAIDPRVVRAGWAEMTLDEKRQLVGMFIDRVVVHPAKPGTRRFDPGRVKIEWRTT